jgi:hypothetical protein
VRLVTAVAALPAPSRGRGGVLLFLLVATTSCRGRRPAASNLVADKASATGASSQRSPAQRQFTGVDRLPAIEDDPFERVSPVVTPHDRL